jgi:hypothetical protein
MMERRTALVTGSGGRFLIAPVPNPGVAVFPTCHDSATSFSERRDLVHAGNVPTLRA